MTSGVAAAAVCGALIFGGLTAAVDWGRGNQNHSMEKPVSQENGRGGKGGDAKVFGSGVGIGGPGGHGGRLGRGGDGGSVEVHGDGYRAAGGAGGSISDDGVWRPPAKSGYEVHQRALGLPVDPYMRQFGRGGAAPGYEPKLQVVNELRAAYFRDHGVTPRGVFEDINAVPLDYLNDALAARNEDWRVRIVEDDEYEFFIPR
jgi:hypothetical protein